MHIHPDAMAQPMAEPLAVATIHNHCPGGCIGLFTGVARF